MEVNDDSILAMSTFHHLALYLLVLSLSAPALCSAVADSEEHELALIDSLPLLAEPDLEHVDGGLVVDESELAVERTTPAATWSATVEYADPNSPTIEGNYGFALSTRHARGFSFAFARDRKEITLSEAFAFGSKTLLRFAIGNAHVENGEAVNDPGARLVERKRSAELTRRVLLPQTAIELGIGAYGTDALDEDAINTASGWRRALAANLSVVPASSDMRFDMGLTRQVLDSFSGTDNGERSNGYRLRAIGQLQQCHILDIEYAGTSDARIFSAHLDATR